MLWILVWLFAAGIAVLAYASVIERNWFALRTHRVACLPPGTPPMKVLHLSDLHLRAPQRRKRAFLRSLARIEPDLIVGTGDFLGDGSTQAVEATVDAMTATPARLASMFVLGSNDYYSPVPKNPLRYFRKRKGPHAPGKPNPWPDMVERLQRAGWLAMNNRTVEVGGIDVLGLDDAHIGRADMRLAKARTAPGFRLAVAHSPDVANDLAGLGYDLIVCGHTHGGQVCVPGFGALVTNCSLPRSMASGLHRIGDAWLHVSAGLGTSMYAPYRLACRPEVCVLELVERQR